MDSEITTAGANMCRRRWQAPACGERADLPVLAGSRANAAISLCELERLPGTKELEQVVRESDHSPLGPDLGHAAFVGPCSSSGTTRCPAIAYCAPPHATTTCACASTAISAL